ncbi:hypothetical protein [Romboutsia lituseburensis]|uniref:hypothetical protein n=1 Tax=Romboutsia lituseburensis TaxID=1537 RepID=UPI00215AA989|nr:hypothetical protein [Romboutsia lituseburensis]MCR8743776.1 hypothetical protein [Romboutsia lituseburensis]
MLNILSKLKNSLQNSFNIYDDYCIENYNFDFMGEFLLTNSKFFLSKDKVIYSYDNNEYVFAKEVNCLSKEYLEKDVLPFAEYALSNIVKTNENHMSSIITLFLSSSFIESNLKTYIRKYKKRKSYMFGLKGYASTRIILHDKSTNELFYNNESKDIINFYKGVFK